MGSDGSANLTSDLGTGEQRGWVLLDATQPKVGTSRKLHGGSSEALSFRGLGVPWGPPPWSGRNDWSCYAKDAEESSCLTSLWPCGLSCAGQAQALPLGALADSGERAWADVGTPGTTD